MSKTSRTPFAPVMTAFALSWLALAPAVAQAPPRAIDPCALLTVSEVSTVMGQPVEPGKYIDNGLTKDGARSTTCLWAVALPAGVAPDPTKSLGGQSFSILNISNWPGGAKDAQKYLESFHKAYVDGDIPSKPVAVEVGADEALWWGDGVAARKNGVSFGMSVASAGDRAARKPRAESLAKLVLQRLPKTPT